MNAFTENLAGGPAGDHSAPGVTEQLPKPVLGVRPLQKMHFLCPFCERSSDRLLPVGLASAVLTDKRVVGAGQRMAECVYCGSWDRERLVYLYLKYDLKLFTSAKRKSILHIAPEKVLSQRLGSLATKEYVRGDLIAEAYGVGVISINLLDIKFQSDRFDLIICNHVLEHIEDDRKAMRELWRVLRPHGVAILQVPISKSCVDTSEDFTVQDPAERERLFGQRDHCRIYGQDYVDRLAGAGFFVGRLRIGHLFESHGVNKEEDLFVCRKGLLLRGTRHPQADASNPI